MTKIWIDDFEDKVLYTSSLGHGFEIHVAKLKNTNKNRKNKVVGLINQLKQIVDKYCYEKTITLRTTDKS